MKFIYYILPLVAGIAMSIQAGVNNQLRSALQQPLLATLISFLSGTLALVIILLAVREPLPSLQSVSEISLYKFTGGLLGAFIVFGTILSVSEIGAANLIVILIAGQLVTAVIMDHYGILGMSLNRVTLQRIIGILLVVAGAYLVNKK